MAVATYRNDEWSASEIKPVAPLEISPAAHVLHYASTCFEGFKAFRHTDGSIHVFRMDRHIQRMRQSARQLVLPEPDPAQLAEMVRAVIQRCRDAVPEAPGALYLRPMLFGTTANIGAAAIPSTEATLIVLASPVWDYFSGGMKPLRILVDDINTR
jgi:branched-chain amino acid aminotransferase